MADNGVSRNVVVAMDDSDHAKEAFNWYVNNLHCPGDSVILVNVVDMYDTANLPVWYSAPAMFDGQVMVGLISDIKTKTQQLLEKFAEMMKQAKVKGTVKSTYSNQPGEGIIKVAEEYNAQLIVTGSRGMGKVRRTLLGSTSEYILNHSKVPVAVCRTHG